ncbi:MAG TPA: ATP-dependent 6-phosphofructokinase [Alphaproteobacteria bacterium]|nr:ATP-dependent 6-phosphofructokinase [Alphaproteobacteria bacterium]
MTKRIGILTSGGDCAGLNAAIRAVVLRAAAFGWTVVGIRNGTAGLMERPVQADELGFGVTDTAVMRQGGTILGTTNKGDPFAFPLADGRKIDRSGEIIEGYRMLRLDALIGIGGDGSFAILRRLAQQGGINLVGIPKTIDNDLDMTQISLGFSTAVEVATEALDNLQPTAASHSRVMILEVMGRDAGHIALAAGIAGGADIVLIPEIPWRIEAIKAKIEAVKARGRNFALVVVSEAVRTATGTSANVAYAGGQVRYGGIGHYFADEITRLTGAEARVTQLGHVQRGGAPVARDRLLAMAFGVKAVELIASGQFDRMVALWNGEIADVPLGEAIKHPNVVDPAGSLARTARGLGICLGD